MHRYAQTLQATLSKGLKRACLTTPPTSPAPGKGNRISDDGAVQLAKGLPASVVSLNLLGNPIGSYGVKEVLSEVIGCAGEDSGLLECQLSCWNANGPTLGASELNDLINMLQYDTGHTTKVLDLGP